MNHLSKRSFTIAVLLLSFLLLLNGTSDALAQYAAKHQVVKMLPQKHNKNHLNAVLPAANAKTTAYKQPLSKAESTFQINQLRIANANNTLSNKKAIAVNKTATIKPYPTNIQRISKETLKHQFTTTPPQKGQAFQKTQMTKSSIISHKK